MHVYISISMLYIQIILFKIVTFKVVQINCFDI